MLIWKSAAVTALLLLAAFPVEAQQPQFSQKIEVKLVEIDVSVTGRDGKPVHGLTRDDFEVFEGRSRQQITNFTEYASSSSVQSVASSPSAGNTPAPSLPEPHQLLVLIDSLPREQFIRTRVFSDLDILLSKTMHQGDSASVVFWSPGFEKAKTIIEPTRDLETVRRVLDKLGRTYTTDGGEKAEADNNDAEDQFIAEAAAFAGGGVFAGEQASSDNFNGEAGLMKLRRKAAAIQRMVTSLAGPGKKVLLYVSNSFSMPREAVARTAAVELLNNLVKAANAAGVVFYAVHPAPFEEAFGVPNEKAAEMREASFNALQSLTMPTGGLVDMSVRSIDSLGARLTEDLESYYSIAYQARSDGRDRERRIVVKTKNPDDHVRSRESYVEKSNETRARDDVMARLFSDQGADDVHFELVEGAPDRTSGERWLLPIVLKIPTRQLQFAPEGRDQVAHVKVLIVAGNGVAEVTKVNEDNLRIVESKVDTGFVTYEVKILSERRGSKVSIGVFDARSGLLGVKSIDTRGRFH